MVLQTESGNIPLPETVMRLEHARNKIEKPVDPNPQEMENLKRQFPCEYPVNPHMKHFNARLQTFDQRWPIQKGNATPQHIAKAGFYFLGNFYKTILQNILLIHDFIFRRARSGKVLVLQWRTSKLETKR